MEEVPRRTSLAPFAFPCFVLCLIGVEAEGLLDYQGRAGIMSIVRWNLRPVIFGVENWGVLGVSSLSSLPWCLGKYQGKPPKTTRNYCPSEPQETPRKTKEKAAENTQNTKEFPWLEKTPRSVFLHNFGHFGVFVGSHAILA